MSTVTASETMTGRQVMARLGCTHMLVLKRAAMGQIRAVAKLGQPLRFVREDVEKVAKELGR
jgi:hypothetical protein